MAAASVLAVMNGSAKDIHSFFTKPRECPAEAKQVLSNKDGPHDSLRNATLEEQHAASTSAAKRRKATKDDSTEQNKTKTQRTIRDILNPKVEPPITCVDSVAINQTQADVVFLDETPATAHEPNIAGQLTLADENTINPSTSITGNTCEERDFVVRDVSHPVVEIPFNPDDQPKPASRSQTPPRKVLRLRPNGTFASPPMAKATADGQSLPTGQKQRGRARKGRNPNGALKLLVRIPYGQANHEARKLLGTSIERILMGEQRVAIPNMGKQATKKPRTPRKPFAIFADKGKTTSSDSIKEPRKKTSTVTPGKLRTQTLNLSACRPDFKDVHFDLGSGLFKDRFLMKQPGAKDAPWPSREQAHVRENSATEVHWVKEIHGQFPAPTIGRRKGKSATLPLSETEAILDRFAARLEPEPCGKERADGFRDPHPSLHIPERLFISGEQILDQLNDELSQKSYNEIYGESTQSPVPSQVSHPALARLRNDIPGHLTAWDENRGDTLPWMHKHAPDKAADVLQSANEMDVLKRWLISHTVSAVGNSTATESKVQKSDGKPKKKRRRKHDEFDDFLVHSDDEYQSMQEIPLEYESDEHALPRSVVQDAANGARLNNAVLLSGPHGCGKTAAVYAVARELGFKVFEINSHERRTGKDVMDKIGDMTENHLVKHHGTDSATESADETASRLGDELDSDIASGRQVTMTSFFSSKSKSKQALPETALKRQALETVQKATKASTKSQQQSLILLEEVDVLFKEDKDFWSTILRLMLSSKRPFIMTCNDEDLIPLQAISLHAILRFVPPSSDLAVDYILLLAAKEGHILNRLAVTSLYDYKRHDLRASISELNFWCQMGVGDPRGGLGWLFQRWPPGAGVDELGRQLRVVSRSTYLPLMSLPEDHDQDLENRMLETWQEEGINPTSWLDWEHMTTKAWFDLRPGNSSRKQRRTALAQLSAFADALSDSDCFAGTCSVSGNLFATDQPSMPEKARGHYVDGMRVLQTDVVLDYAKFGERIAISTAVSAFRTFRLDCPNTAPRAQQDRGRVGRRDFACFDAIAVGDESGITTATGLQLSAFDGPFTTLVVDLAPYARSIVRSDLALQQYRDRLEGILEDADSDAARRPKRARTTRAARSALEGGQRASTRKEQWFTTALDPGAVLATGGSDWGRLEPDVSSWTASVAGSQEQATLGE